MATKQQAAKAHADSPHEKYFRHQSAVIPVGLGTDRLQALRCWTSKSPAVLADPSLLFSLCVIRPGSTQDKYVLQQLSPPSKETFEVDPDCVLNANTEEEELSSPDIGLLSHKNVACVLSMLKTRYFANKMYTTTDPLLVAINPFQDLGNATKEWIDYYRNAPNTAQTEPHVFRVARAALSNLEDYNKSQTIIVSGESGAGKTEATKQVMRYFAAASKGNNKIQDAIMAGNPLLESFGNAKTIRNNNSSRFGRFMQLSVSSDEGILHGAITNFLLEKVRLVSQEPGERCFHVFYQLLKGSDEEMKKKFHLREIHEYKFLTARSGGCFDIEGIDDRKAFQELRESFVSMGLSKEDEFSVYSFLSGVLLLGNTKVSAYEKQGVPDAAHITGESLSILKEAADLLYVDPDALVHNILRKQTKVGIQLLEGPRTQRDADMMIKSLAKHVYDQLFSWLVSFLNKEISPPGGFGVFMGMLDIFGFEVFEHNSLEQLLINITNEHLQKHFIDIIFEAETKLYKSEGIPTETLIWTDNVEIMDSLCGPRDSVFSIIEDICLGLRASDEALCGMVVRKLGGKGVVLPSRRDQRIKFIVRHTIADIEYSCDGFLEKNQDILKKELIDVLKASHNKIMIQMFENVVVEAGKIGKGSLIASQFLRSLNSMIALIRKTEPHFIRCLKPNETKQPHEWDGPKVLNQLFSLSILEALQLRQVGYSYRRPFDEFIKKFRFLNLAAANSDIDRQHVALSMLQASGLADDEWAVGKTMIFLKAEAARALETLQTEKMMALRPLVEFIEAAYSRIIIKRNLTTILPSLIRAEAHCRRQVAVYVHGELDLSSEFREALIEGIDIVNKNKEKRERERQMQEELMKEKKNNKKLTKEEQIAKQILNMYKHFDSYTNIKTKHEGFFPPQNEFQKEKYQRPTIEQQIKETEIRLHEEAAEKSYIYCRRQDFSGLVRARKSLVPPYMLQDVSYLMGHLYERYKESRDWRGFAERLQSYLIGRYSDSHGGAWNVLVQEGGFVVTRLWVKHNRFFRVEINENTKKNIYSTPRIITIICFEACTAT